MKTMEELLEDSKKIAKMAKENYKNLVTLLIQINNLELTKKLDNLDKESNGS